MKKILTLVLILFFVKAGAQISVNSVTCGEHTYYVRVAITEIFVPAHAVSTTTCPDNSVHDDTEEGSYVECRMALYQDAACSQPVSVDPRFFSFARDVPGSTGTQNNPSFIYRSACPTPLPAGSTYDNNFRVDHAAISIKQCIWECIGAGFYNCYSTDFGVPLNFNIVINCCYAPSSLAVHLVNFNGQRNAVVNTLTWVIGDKPDFARLDLERSFDGTNYMVVYSTGDPNIDKYIEQTNNTAYYRLKIFSSNGMPQISPTILLKNLSFIQKSFIVSPSPFDKLLNVSVSATTRLQSVFKLVSPEGKLVFKAERELKAGMNHFIFNIPPVSRGIYIMTMSNDESTLATKVLKQ